MADQMVKAARVQLIQRLNQAVVKDLLDLLQEEEVLNTGEVEEVLEGNSTTKEKSRCLLDMLIKKGPRACHTFLSFLHGLDQELCTSLEL
ncbi:caspase recruitment domain-containing protein 18-like [Lepisosteus oculatus]|uniref:caspase recruitment domain-containing protein 18-like n=1 Tax=Lepisosteus oculatus TaxID=7918 RepID=UPI0007400ACE|nr:PREDICTED: caspase-1-like [Lepisosteus oculatus]